MVLAIDVGNTNITIGLFEKDGTPAFFSDIATNKDKTSDQCAMDLLGVFHLYQADMRQVQGAIISCVVPPLVASITEAVERIVGKPPLMVGPGMKTGLNIRSDLHNQLGGDLVAASVAAVANYPSPVIIVGMGTATTFSLLKNGVYEGCALYPGIRLGLEALSEQAAELPHIALEAPSTPLGRNTIDAMRSGVLYGNAGLVDSMVSRFEEACGSPVAAVVATGKLAPSILEHCTRDIIFDPHLQMSGLYLIYKKNTEKHRR